MQFEHRHPWLIADLGTEMRALSWAPHNPGYVFTRKVVWREVRNADLTKDFDAEAWLATEMASVELSQAVGLLTSRSLASHHFAEAQIGPCRAQALATVGLGNAERVGRRLGARSSVGTINTLVCINQGLSDVALLEAISIVAEARTAAVSKVGHLLSTGVATGTGTDCIVIAAPQGAAVHVGKHTDVGEALGGAVYAATLAGAQEWMTENT